MKKQVLYFSVLRAVSCIAIVILHTFWIANNLFAPENSLKVFTMTVRNSMLWAVPCFVMVSGALLLNPEKEIGLKKIATVYVKRAAAALLVCTLLFTIFDNIVGNLQLGVGGVISGWLRALMTNGSWLHLWYLYLLIGIYLMLPIYRIVSKNCSDKELSYLLVLYLVFQSVIPTLNSVLGRNIGFYLPVYTVYPFYLFMGYAMHERKVKLATPALWGLLFINTAAIVTVTITGILYENTRLQALAGSYASIPVVMQSIAIFGLLQNGMETKQDNPEKKENMLLRVLKAIDQDSFMIYLLHVATIYVLYRCFAWNPYQIGVVGTVVASIGVFFATWLVSRVVNIVLLQCKRSKKV